ncbi:MAG: MarR family transcriptional regulator [Gammaproteobacteria bacterium]|nr:MarR family transcriptional regulator [Gammaproteobacteria bacterium]
MSGQSQKSEIEEQDVNHDQKKAITTEDTYLEVLSALRKVIHAIDLYSKKISRETGLTAPQLLVMRAIHQNDSVMVKQIADFINLSAATVVSILDRLELRGFIERERSKSDKRKLKLHLTSEGRKVLKAAPQLLQKHFIERYNKLSTSKQIDMVTTINQIAGMMDANQINPPALVELTSFSLEDKDEA